MSFKFQKGDRVQWHHRGRPIRGFIVEELTAPHTIKGYTMMASESKPRYLVRSETTGKEAVHRLEALMMLYDDV